MTPGASRRPAVPRRTARGRRAAGRGSPRSRSSSCWAAASPRAGDRRRAPRPPVRPESFVRGHRGQAVRPGRVAGNAGRGRRLHGAERRVELHRRRMHHHRRARPVHRGQFGDPRAGQRRSRRLPVDLQRVQRGRLHRGQQDAHPGQPAEARHDHQQLGHDPAAGWRLRRRLRHLVQSHARHVRRARRRRADDLARPPRRQPDRPGRRSRRARRHRRLRLHPLAVDK